MRAAKRAALLELVVERRDPSPGAAPASNFSVL
jgi:hypothetical protein